MIVINTVTSTRFSLNGIEYHKNFMPFITGNKINIINVYDGCIYLTPAPTIFSDFIVNGATYASAAELQAALLDVLYTRNSLSGGGGINGTVGFFTKFTDVDEVGNSILKEIGNAIHLTNGTSSYASFGIINPGVPGEPGVDNDAYIGSTINNDFLIRVNNTEALRIDTALRLKIANIQNAPTDTDKFLVSDGGVVKYRTGAEVLSDIGGISSATLANYLPLTGGTLTGGLIGTTGSFTSSGSSDTFAINHSSGSGVGLRITKGGNGEGLYVNKTGGSGNAATIVGTLEATTFIKTGGISSQFLKADGSVDSNTYATTSQLHNPVTLGTANGLSLSGQVLSLGLASASTTGALSTSDYISFSNKQNALTNPITGTGTAGQLAKFSATGTIADSIVFDSGTFVIVGTGGNIGNIKFQVNGNARVKDELWLESTINKGSYVYTLPSATGTLALTSQIPTVSGTTNYIPKFTGAGTIGNSQIFDNGTNVGIGTTSPGGKIHVKETSSEIPFVIDSSSASNPSYTQYRVNNSSGWEHGMSGVGDSYKYFFSYGSFGAANSKLAITSGGNVLIGTTTDAGYKLDVNGTLRISGAATFSSSVTATAFFESSSIAGKNVLTTNPITDLNIDVIKYTRKKDESKDIRYGYSAEQINALMPELTDKDVTAVKYLDVHTLLIQQLTNRIKELEAKLN